MAFCFFCAFCLTGLRSEAKLVTFVIYRQYVSLFTIIYNSFVVWVLLSGHVSAAKFYPSRDSGVGAQMQLTGCLGLSGLRSEAAVSARHN